MPYHDLPFWHKAQASEFDFEDPCSLWHYFKNLDLLFVRHQVLNSSKKKQAAVQYPELEVEHLWKSTLSYSDPAQPYK